MLQLPIMAQYPIPQFTEAEGKIIFFLTFKQFFLLVGGGAFCALFYYTLPFFVFVIGSLVVVIIVGAIGFLKVDDVPVAKLMLNALGYFLKAKIYTWKKKESPYPFKNKPTQFTAPEPEKSKLAQTQGIVEYRKRNH